MVILKDINLMPASVVAKKRYKKLMNTLIMGIVIAVSISVVTDAAIYIYKSNYDNKIKQQESRIVQKIGAQTDSNVQNIIRDKIVYKNEVYDKVKGLCFDVNRILNQIEKMIPVDVSIETLNISEKGLIIINGEADNEDSVLDFYYNIKSSELTDYVVFDGLDGEFGGTKGFNFIFEFQLKGIGSDIIETE